MRRNGSKLFLMLTAAGLLLPASVPATAKPLAPSAGRVAYIYNTDTSSRDSFSALLTDKGVQVDLVALANASTFDFSADQAIIIGSDTGSTSSWSITATVNQIRNAGKPIIGVGEGGYAFFGTAGLALDIGYKGGTALHITETQAYVMYPSQPVFVSPAYVPVPTTRLLTLYTTGVNVVEPIVSVTPVGVPLAHSVTGRNLTLPDMLYSIVTQQSGGRCHTLWGFTGAPSLMTGAGKDLFVNIVLGEPCARLTMTAANATTSPNIDGRMDEGEWPVSSQLNIGHGFMRASNNGVRLFLLFDVIADTTNDLPTATLPIDTFAITFNVNGDNTITPNTDVNYTHNPGAYNMRYQYYTGPNAFGALQPTTRSSLGPGFGCSVADGSQTIASPPSASTCVAHRIWELGIDLREINAGPGDTLQVGLRLASKVPAFAEQVPANFKNDFSNLIWLRLANATGTLPVANPSAAVSFLADPFEVTQAVQTLGNTLPLVAGKNTVTRVNVRTADVAAPEPALVYLYGTRSGNDLPGSPLARLMDAPLAPNRAAITDTANMTLPRAWVTAGATRFTAAVARLDSNLSFSPPSTLTLLTRRAPVIWIVPLNTGTATSPTVVSNSEIITQENYMKAVYPVPGVQFIQQSWTAVGAFTNTVNLTNAKRKLNDYYQTAVAAWAISYWFTGQPPFDLPDAIYGFMTSGGGSSDPIWSLPNGLGRVAAGYRGTSLEGTMAHELNHIFDRNAVGTWGLHVQPGCGATGSDPNWPYPTSNINEIGFDTRLPWVLGGGRRSTVITSTTPDFQSYCQSGRLPTKWISPYRWSNLFNNAGFVPAFMRPETSLVITDVYYISGRLTQTGTVGALDPISAQVGIPTDAPIAGDYSIELQNGLGTVLQTIPFSATFVDVEGEPVEAVDFNFQIPQQAEVSRVVLKNGATELATIVKSASVPGAGFTYPAGGEIFSGTTAVQWSASDLDPGSELAFSLMFSTDGLNWLPVATGISGNSADVAMMGLPSTATGRFRLIVTDGFNTNSVDSSEFTVTGSQPTVNIFSPESNETFTPEALLTLQGDATDTTYKAIPDNRLFWSYAPIGGASGTPFGLGREASLMLHGGTYSLTLTAYDGAGNAGQASVRVTIIGNGVAFLPMILR